MITGALAEGLDSTVFMLSWKEDEGESPEKRGSPALIAPCSGRHRVLRRVSCGVVMGG